MSSSPNSARNRIYDDRDLDVKTSLLNQELDEFRLMKIAETDISRYESERQLEILLEHAEAQ